MNIFEKEVTCPIGNGGGTCKTIEDVEKLIKTEIWAVEIGSITEIAREGFSGNTFHDGKYFTLNALGLPNGGRIYYEANLPAMIGLIHSAGKVAIVNIVGFSKEECAGLTSLAFICGADLVVINAGCPNVWVDGQQKGILTYDYSFDSLRKIIVHTLEKNIKEATEGRIGLKLSPICDPLHLKKMAEFVDSFVFKGVPYIGFITTQNTIPNCYDQANDGYSVISPVMGFGGMAGDAVFPMALGQVKQFRNVMDAKVKIIGVGGIKTGKDVSKMISNGADRVQIVSAYYCTGNVGIFNEIGAEYLHLQHDGEDDIV